MNNDKIIKLLGEVRRTELTAISQYIGHHYDVEGMHSAYLKNFWRKASIDEMKHAEILAERMKYLGGAIPYEPLSNPKRGGDIKKMLMDDLELEKDAVERLKSFIKSCSEVSDYVSSRILEDILADEEAHIDEIQRLLK